MFLFSYVAEHLTQPIAAVLAALIAAFAGSLLGAVTALSRFKRERAFDRRLNWYEQAIEALHDMAQKIEIARTFQEESGTDDALLDQVWRDVQAAQLALENIGHKAALYGSNQAMKITKKILREVQEAANETEAFAFRAIKEQEQAAKLLLIDGLSTKLAKAAMPLWL